MGVLSKIKYLVTHPSENGYNFQGYISGTGAGGGGVTIWPISDEALTRRAYRVTNAAVDTELFYVTLAGDLYAAGDVSALTFTDRTPFFKGDAIEKIKKILPDANGNIDHSTLPEEAVSMKGRDIGAMVSILTVAIQQLTDRIETIEKRN